MILQWNGDAILAQIQGYTDQAIGEVADRTQFNAVQNLTEREHDIFTPTPAAPGQSPAMITGHLSESVYKVRIGPLSWAVYSASPYAHIQEVGGTNTSTSGFPHPIGDLGRQFMINALVMGFYGAIKYMGLFPIHPRNRVVKVVYCTDNGNRGSGRLTPVVYFTYTVHVPARPWMLPALLDVLPDVPKIFWTTFAPMRRTP